MAKQQRTRERVYDLRLRGMMQHVDVGDTPVGLTDEFTDTLVDEIHLLFRGDVYLTKADTQGEATSNLADVTKRRKAVKGETISYFRTSGKIWAKKSGSSAVTIDKEIYEQGCD